MQPHVLVTSHVPDDLLAELVGSVRITRGPRSDRTMSRSDVPATLSDVQAASCQNELRRDAELLAPAPRLLIVANATAGFDNMDRSAMATYGVWGTSFPLSFASATADHTLALLLAVARRVVNVDAYVRRAAWKTDGWIPGRWDGMSLEGKTLGIARFGVIGRDVAKRAEGFGMKVLHFDSTSRDAPGWRSLGELLGVSDALSLHCLLTPETKHLLNVSSLAKVKRGAILLNVSRGPIADLKAIVTALRNGSLGGAGLDVFEFEPEVPDELLEMRNMVLTPHISGETLESNRSAWGQCARNVALGLAGKSPATPVVVPAEELSVGAPT